jgi:hypothetical protein
VVEPDHPDVEERRGEGEVLGPLVQERRPEAPIVDFGPADLDDQEGDRDPEHAVAERLDPRARHRPALASLGRAVHAAPDPRRVRSPSARQECAPGTAPGASPKSVIFASYPARLPGSHLTSSATSPERPHGRYIGASPNFETPPTIRARKLMPHRFVLRRVRNARASGDSVHSGSGRILRATSRSGCTPDRRGATSA